MPSSAAAALASAPAEARAHTSSFGDDSELAKELPPDWTLSRFQKSVQSTLAEYFVALAVKDTAVQVGELLAKCPSEADELGVLAIRAAIDHDEAARTAVVALLSELCRSSTLDRSALVRSFEKLFCTWEDIVIDAPTAPEALLCILHGFITADILDRSLLTKLPENLLKAGIARASPEISSLLSGVTGELKEFKRQATRCLEEFFGTPDDTAMRGHTVRVDEVAAFLKDLRLEGYRHEFVKKAIAISFSQTDVDAAREEVLTLLKHLTSVGVLCKDDLQWGITRLLAQLDDLQLDCPRAVDLTIELCVRLIACELVSVPFLRRCRLLRIGGATGLQVLDATRKRTPEYSKRQLDTAHFKQEIQTMILEYFDAGDDLEFGRCVRELGPFNQDQSAELIRKIMVFAMERSGAKCEMGLKLMVSLSHHEGLAKDAIERGFDDLYARMPDLLLDVPDAEAMAKSFVVEAKKANILRIGWPATEAE